MKKSFLLLAIGAITSLISFAEPVRAGYLFDRQQDVIYGRKFGTALTMDVFKPKENSNHASVVLVMSGGWVSSKDQIQPIFVLDLVKRGYTVFAVVHGSQPKFTIPECVADLHRAVRYIRTNAEHFEIDPNRIGISGASAGGHLSLMMGLRRRDRQSEGQGPGRSRVEPGTGRGVLLSADRFSELRQNGRKGVRHRAEPSVQGPLRFPRARGQHEALQAGRPGNCARRSSRRSRRSITSRKTTRRC